MHPLAHFRKFYTEHPDLSMHPSSSLNGPELLRGSEAEGCPWSLTVCYKQLFVQLLLLWCFHSRQISSHEWSCGTRLGGSPTRLTSVRSHCPSRREPNSQSSHPPPLPLMLLSSPPPVKNWLQQVPMSNVLINKGFLYTTWEISLQSSQVRSA